MAKTYSRVKRGMVFWFNPDKVYQEAYEYTAYNGKVYKTNIQRGCRPYLVTSNDEGNSSAPTCNIVPITLEDKADIPVHVQFMYEGKRQTILCEQPRTVDIMALQDYIYTVSDEVMEQVERAFAIQHGIRPKFSCTDFQLENVVDKLESIITSIIEHKMKAVREQHQTQVPLECIEDTAMKLGVMIEDLVGSVVSETQKTSVEKSKEVVSENTEIKRVIFTQPIIQPKETPKEEAVIPKKTTLSSSLKSTPINPVKNCGRMSQIDKFNQRLEKGRSMNVNKSEAHFDTENKEVEVEEVKTKKRNSWTIEKRKEYLADCDRLSPEDVMKKYNFSAIQTVFQTKYLCKTALLRQGIKTND